MTIQARGTVGNMPLGGGERGVGAWPCVSLQWRKENGASYESAVAASP